MYITRIILLTQLQHSFVWEKSICTSICYVHNKDWLKKRYVYDIIIYITAHVHDIIMYIPTNRFFSAHLLGWATCEMIPYRYVHVFLMYIPTYVYVVVMYIPIITFLHPFPTTCEMVTPRCVHVLVMYMRHMFMSLLWIFQYMFFGHFYGILIDWSKVKVCLWHYYVYNNTCSWHCYVYTNKSPFGTLHRRDEIW